MSKAELDREIAQELVWMQEERCTDAVNEWFNKQPKSVQDSTLAAVEQGKAAYDEMFKGIFLTRESKQAELERCDTIPMAPGWTREQCKEAVRKIKTGDVDYISKDSYALGNFMLMFTPPEAQMECT